MTNGFTRLGLAHIYCAVLGLLVSGPLAAAEPAGIPEAIEVRVSAGTADGQLRFVPDHFSFERGKYYKLVINNPSKDEHYFTSDAFATHVFTRKIEVMSADGKTLAEIHGAVNDIELKPGATVAWYFYPMTKGEGLALYCHKENHAHEGMTGTIDISGPPPFSR